MPKRDTQGSPWIAEPSLEKFVRTIEPGLLGGERRRTPRSPYVT
jgi:hypothetical protein